MALIFCPECNRAISEKAAACPFCGFPSPAGKGKSVADLLGILERYDTVIEEAKKYRDDILENKNRHMATHRADPRRGRRYDYSRLDELATTAHRTANAAIKRRDMLHAQMATANPPAVAVCELHIRAMEETMQAIRLSYQTLRASGFTPGYVHRDPNA